MKAIDTMVGDSPYMKTTIQPWEVWLSWELNPWEASAVKRIQRWRREGGKGTEDLRKAIHELTHILELAEAGELPVETPAETDSASQETTFRKPEPTSDGSEKTISESMEELTRAMYEPLINSLVSRDTNCPHCNLKDGRYLAGWYHHSGCPHYAAWERQGQPANKHAPVCLAGQMSDQMRCEACNLTWDRNDPDPPPCGRADQGFVRLPHQEGGGD